MHFFQLNILDIITLSIEKMKKKKKYAILLTEFFLSFFASETHSLLSRALRKLDFRRLTNLYLY
jgi:hypothetical protein